MIWFSSDTLISYACMENATFEERIEKSGRATQGFILVWHFDDIIVPQAVFSAPAVSRSRALRSPSSGCLFSFQDSLSHL